MARGGPRVGRRARWCRSAWSRFPCPRIDPWLLVAFFAVVYEGGVYVWVFECG